jgi:outer membrane protein TolC
MKLIIPLFCCAVAFGLTEEEAIVKALSRNPNATVQTMRVARDQLLLSAAKSDRGLHITGTVQGTGYKDGSGNYHSPVNNSFADIGAAYYLPGGGRIESRKARVEGTINGESSISNPYNIHYTQSLLKQAWGAGDLDASVGTQETSLSVTKAQKLEVLNQLIADIRTSYWSLVSKQLERNIRREETEDAERLLSLQRHRLELGEAMEMDTLAASLTSLQAKDAVKALEDAIVEERENIAFLMRTLPDSIGMPADQTIIHIPVKRPEELLKDAADFNPTLQSLIAERGRLKMVRKQSLFNMFPDLEVTAGIEKGQGFTENNTWPDSAGPYASVNLVYDLFPANYYFRWKSAKKEVMIQETLINKYCEENNRIILQQYRLWKSSVERFPAHEMECLVADKAYMQAERVYQSGSLELLNLIRVKEDRAFARLAKLDAELAMKIMEIELDRLTGAKIREAKEKEQLN